MAAQHAPFRDADRSRYAGGPTTPWTLQLAEMFKRERVTSPGSNRLRARRDGVR
jgi:hypothetical protein